MSGSPPPPLTPATEVIGRMRLQGYAVLDRDAVCGLASCDAAQLAALAPGWDDLALDTYLRDGGRYRRRRHACFVQDADALVQAPHRAHWQSQDYNALHGGMHRWFEPVADATLAQPAWAGLIRGFGKLLTQLRGQSRWYVEAHQFRIDTTDGIGRPTPEGAHRDGVDFVVVLLVDRVDVKGGETRVFEADGTQGQRFTLGQPWSALLLDDARVIHESTPIQPLAEAGHRDTLVLTYRAGAFQGED
ncbi:2OG-Fe dioxygenase family protein [Pseudoxanthomonas spadix]|nr:2OG-Fe dioxygenase family protein [Pseudoxanthomonas spadix]